MQYTLSELHKFQLTDGSIHDLAPIDFLLQKLLGYLLGDKGYLSKTEGHQLVTRNGYQPIRSIQTGIGPIEVKNPRVKSPGEELIFSSAILPPYLRRIPSLDALIPALYLKGVAMNDFPEALSAILGESAKGLSPTNIARLKESWEEEYEEWSHRSLEGKHYVY